MKKTCDNAVLFAFTFMLIMSILVFVLPIFFNCKDEVNVEATENIIDTVQIVDSYEYTTGGTVSLVGKTPICTPRITHYITVVKYKGKKYKVDNCDTYKQFKNKKGQNVKATIKKITYKDKKIKYEIKDLYENCHRQGSQTWDAHKSCLCMGNK